MEENGGFGKKTILYPNPKKLRIQTSWSSRDWQQLKSAFFGGPSICEAE
ncbi:MAG: hypothetical protein LBS83_03740 [Holosporales bacterium]|nr:hypothetical protein [Holosporales bacterium]